MEDAEPRQWDVEKRVPTMYEERRAIRVISGSPVANPAPLGLMAFGFTTALLQGAVTGLAEPLATKDLTFGFGLFYGGLAQLLAGMWEMRRNNTFAATAFSSYGAFWLSFSIYGILSRAGIWDGTAIGVKRPPYALKAGDEMMLSLWGIVTFLFFLQTIKINRALQALFFTLSVLFFLLAVGVKYVIVSTIAGYWGLFVAAIAFYIATAEMFVDSWGKEVLPLGHVRKAAAPAVAAK